MRVSGFRLASILFGMATGCGLLALAEILVRVVDPAGPEQSYRSLAYDYTAWSLGPCYVSRSGKLTRVASPPAWGFMDDSGGFPTTRTPGVGRVAVVGESTGALLESAMVALAKGCSEPIEILRCSTAGENATVIERRFAEVLDYSPDAIVVALGHNLGLPEPPTPLQLWSQWLDVKSRLAHEILSRKPPVRIVKRLGREDLAARAGAAYRTMTHQARDRGVAVVALLLSSNLWMPPENQDRSEIESPEHFAAWIRWARGDLDGALAELRKPGAGAVRAFERATFLVQAGDWEGAHRDFVFARDHDPLGTRASTEINAAIAETASAEGAHVIDVEALFAPLADHGIPGWEVFADNCHPRPHALDLLARALMREVGAEACASRRWSGGDAPCPSQGCNIALPQDIGALAHPAAMGRDHPRRVFEGPFLALLRLAPADAPARIAQYADGELVRHDAPTRAAMLTAIGAAARNAGRHDLAREYLSRSLAVERTPAALVELALTVLRGGDEAAARTTLDEALLLDPTHVQARGLRTALEQ